MSKQTLATKYRPTTFDDVTEQTSTKVILQQQLETGDFKNAYLFVGGAGTGKTTCARIFANEINKYEGEPIELDAASNNGVDDAREIIQQAKTKSLDSEYKIFIIDECHMLSNSAWNALLKLIEEPPAKSIFIFCTTNPEKIPKTILSRVQRFDFKRISELGIVDRLLDIIDSENSEGANIGSYRDVISYIAKLADGGMRDAITMLDKCISLSNDITMEIVIDALGVADFETMRKLTDACIDYNTELIISIVEDVHSSGKDLKQFIRHYVNFILDIRKYQIFKNFGYISIPNTDDNATFLDEKARTDYEQSIIDLLNLLIKINAEIKYDSSPKYMIEAMLLGGLK